MTIRKHETVFSFNGCIQQRVLTFVTAVEHQFQINLAAEPIAAKTRQVCCQGHGRDIRLRHEDFRARPFLVFQSNIEIDIHWLVVKQDGAIRRNVICLISQEIQRGNNHINMPTLQILNCEMRVVYPERLCSALGQDTKSFIQF